MNGLDIFLLIIIAICIVGGLILLIMCCTNYDVGGGIACFLGLLLVAGLFSLPFIVLDRGSGSTIGEITSVDKNFFGTTAIYIKTSENSQEKYCIEDNKVAEQAKELLGKKVKIFYGERVGLYSTGDCSQAPVAKIEEMVVTE